MENKSKGRVARAYRISDETVETLKAIADKENCTETAVIENAIRYYKDYLYMQTDGAFINESVKRTFLASVNLMETRLNNRTNKVLSELAIQQAIICQVLAHELEINPRALDNYRRAAVEYLKMNDRVFRLEVQKKRCCPRRWKWKPLATALYGVMCTR